MTQAAERLRVSELLGADVHDAFGSRIGHVHDVRLVQDGPPVAPSTDASLRVAGLVVGPGAVGERLGYTRQRLHRPALVAWALRAVTHAPVFVPWEDIGACSPGRVDLLVSAEELTHAHDPAVGGAG